MKISIALTKGRVEKQFLQYVKTRGFEVGPLIDKGRKLLVETDEFICIFVKGVDVATYVEYGICDIGIVGEDILAEDQPDVFDLMPLPFGKCRFALCGKPESIRHNRKRRIATKYPHVTQRFFREKGESVDIVKLEGSVELAPIVGLADAIVDIVETGNTLRENGLVVIENIQPITSRLIANRSALKLKKDAIQPFIQKLQGEEILK
ncbi:ATP phosphoribosyltransferase [Heyndrickxia acidiproducens]|uniref:ATP phosphoribosyltransferase n=1 Tax=Heyndrickxia acidiproducens TaxID=1121084 RepID=UPI0003707107|nr:ATP phosphoribosyltransferase [Heyndrickxia acidiproducens]